jgi:hypothetical protein
MISGYPHEGGGLFEVGCRLVAMSLPQPVESSYVSLGGFPAPRAARYLKRRALDSNPLYVVLQFGATDAQCPLRPGSRPTRSAHYRTSFDRDYHRQAATVLSLLRWKIASLLGYVRRIEPITPLPSYVAAIQHMVDNCRSAGSTPVVLSPFVYGSQYTMRRAQSYSGALQALYAGEHDVIFVDCVRLLADFPKRSMLQHDGFHLSPRAQALVGEAVGQAIVDHIKARSARQFPMAARTTPLKNIAAAGAAAGADGRPIRKRSLKAIALFWLGFG